mmetsp:Transcript_65780/g.176246  ORF Transcript_65780/g.176246 Transcript_65780/m.176246 type:complete len:224 (+) Transcript_65780:239-910(+)
MRVMKIFECSNLVAVFLAFDGCWKSEFIRERRGISTVLFALHHPGATIRGTQEVRPKPWVLSYERVQEVRKPSTTTPPTTAATKEWPAEHTVQRMERVERMHWMHRVQTAFVVVVALMQPVRQCEHLHVRVAERTTVRAHIVVDTQAVIVVAAAQMPGAAVGASKPVASDAERPSVLPVVAVVVALISAAAAPGASAILILAALLRLLAFLGSAPATLAAPLL